MFRKVQKFHQESLEAGEKCNAAVSGPLSLVGQPNKTRTLIKDLLDASQDKVLHDLAAHNQSLNELQGKAQDLDRVVHHLTQKVSDDFLVWPHGTVDSVVFTPHMLSRSSLRLWDLQVLVLLLPDAAVFGDSNIYHSSFHGHLVHYHSVWLVLHHCLCVTLTW